MQLHFVISTPADHLLLISLPRYDTTARVKKKIAQLVGKLSFWEIVKGENTYI
jgi:hypothetical protein